MNRVDDLANVGDACVGCGIHFHHIHVATLHDGRAMFALTTWFSGWFASAVGPDAVHAFGDNPCGGGFTRPTNTSHHESLGDAICFKSVLERAYHRLLADKVDKGFWPIFTGQYLIGSFGRFRHQKAFIRFVFFGR